MKLFKNYIFLLILFNLTLYSQVTVTSNNLKVDNNLVTNNTIVFNNNPSVIMSLDIKMETADGSTNTTFGNLFLYYKKNADDTPTQIAFQSITFINNYPKTNYINNTFFTSISLFKNNFLSTGGTLYAEYTTNNKNTYKSQVINIVGGGHTTMTPPPNKPDKQILSNVIGNDQILVSGQIPQPFSYETPYYRNLDNLPGRHGTASSGSGSRNIYLTIFKWQIKAQSSDWTDIPGETSPGYSPNKAIYENSSYRRVAFYEGGQYVISNIIYIIINNQSFKNTICCSQILTSSSTGTEEITGNVPTLSNFTYLWQACDQPNYINKVWADMPLATDQNFPRSTYIRTYNGRNTETTAYRRLIKQNGIVISISDPVNITWPIPNTGPGPGRNNGTRPTRTLKFTTNKNIKTNSLILTNDLSDDTTTKENLDIQNIENKGGQNSLKINSNISLYPNPIINNFYLQNINKFKKTETISLFDIFGNKITINKIILSDNLIHINISSLPPGIYFVHIMNDGILDIKKIIKT
jgi:hypothetical protein